MAASAIPREQTGRLATGEALARYGLRFLLVALVVPVHNVLTDYWHLGAPWTDIAAAALAVAIFFHLLRNGRDTPFASLRLPVLLFWAVSAASVLVNHVPWVVGASGLRAMLPWITLGLSAAAVFRPADVPGMLRFAWLAGTALAAYGVLSYLTFRGVGGPFTMPPPGRNLWESVMLYPYQCGAYPVPEGWRLVSTFMNDNYFGVWLTALIPIAFVQSIGESRPGLRRAGLAATVLMTVAFTWTYSRSAALGFLAALGVLVWRGHRTALLLLLPVAIAAPLFALWGDVYRFQHVAATQGGRVESIQRAASTLESSPLLGKGPGTRGLADVNYAKIAYETGLLGLAAFVYLLFSVIRPAFRRGIVTDAASQRLISGMLAGLAAVAVAAVGGEVWETPQIALYFWLTGGLLVVLSTGEGAGRRSPMDQVGCICLT
jgi:hypothetical protein